MCKTWILSGICNDSKTCDPGDPGNYVLSFLYKKKRGLFQTGIALYDGSVFTCFLSDPYLVERPAEKKNAFQHETFSVDHNYKKHAGYGGL